MKTSAASSNDGTSNRNLGTKICMVFFNIAFWVSTDAVSFLSLYSKKLFFLNWIRKGIWPCRVILWRLDATRTYSVHATQLELSVRRSVYFHQHWHVDPVHRLASMLLHTERTTIPITFGKEKKQIFHSFIGQYNKCFSDKSMPEYLPSYSYLRWRWHRPFTRTLNASTLASSAASTAPWPNTIWIHLTRPILT